MRKWDRLGEEDGDEMARKSLKIKGNKYSMRRQGE